MHIITHIYHIYIYAHILISYLRAHVCIYIYTYILKVSRFDIIHQPIQQPRHAPIPPASRVGDVPTPAGKNGRFWSQVAAVAMDF